MIPLAKEIRKKKGIVVWTVLKLGISLTLRLEMLSHASSIKYLLSPSMVPISIETLLSRKVRVDNCLLRRDAASGIVHEKCVEQIQTNVVQRGHRVGDVGACPLGEGWLEVGERSDTGPVHFGGCAEDTRKLAKTLKNE